MLRQMFSVLFWGLMCWAIGFALFRLAMPAPVPAAATTDAIVVLTGGEDRVASGVQRFKDGLGPRLFISGVNPDTSMATLASRFGLSSEDVSCCIVIGKEARDTMGNAREVARWAEAHKLRSIRLVTSTYHMPRARLELKYLMPDVEIIADPISGDLAPTRWAVEYSKFVARWAMLAAQNFGKADSRAPDAA